MGSQRTWLKWLSPHAHVCHFPLVLEVTWFSSLAAWLPSNSKCMMMRQDCFRKPGKPPNSLIREMEPSQMQLASCPPGGWHTLNMRPWSKHLLTSLRWRRADGYTQEAAENLNWRQAEQQVCYRFHREIPNVQSHQSDGWMQQLGSLLVKKPRKSPWAKGIWWRRQWSRWGLETPVLVSASPLPPETLCCPHAGLWSLHLYAGWVEPWYWGSVYAGGVSVDAGLRMATLPVPSPRLWQGPSSPSHPPPTSWGLNHRPVACAVRWENAPPDAGLLVSPPSAARPPPPAPPSAFQPARRRPHPRRGRLCWSRKIEDRFSAPSRPWRQQGRGCFDLRCGGAGGEALRLGPAGRGRCLWAFLVQAGHSSKGPPLRAYAGFRGSRPKVLAPPGVIDNVRPVTYYKQNEYVIRIQSYLGQKAS